MKRKYIKIQYRIKSDKEFNYYINMIKKIYSSDRIIEAEFNKITGVKYKIIPVILYINIDDIGEIESFLLPNEMRKDKISDNLAFILCYSRRLSHLKIESHLFEYHRLIYKGNRYST